MSGVRVSCPAGPPCTYKTEEVDLVTALGLIYIHMRAVHLDVGGGGNVGTIVRKPEKFPRPSIDQDATAEAWEEFHSAWLQYKDEYNLAGTALTRQLYACCSQSLATSLSRHTFYFG